MATARERRVAVGLAVGCFVFAAAASAQANTPPNRHPLRWDPAWSHANVWDYSLTAVGLSALLTEAVVGPIAFDSPVRDLFRLTSGGDQQTAETASWVLWFPLVGYPIVVDVPYAWSRYGPDVAWDLFWQSAAALSLSGAVDFALRDAVARVRPKNTACIQHGGAGCFTGPEVTRSFPSGHVSETTTAAALLCTQHLTLHLYGSPWDGIACATAIAADAGVAVSKLMADDHWASDILGGVALGIAFGWGLPTLTHFRKHSAEESQHVVKPLLVTAVPMAFDRGAGLGVVGMF
jgi:membrane-associated phospholipid phosphatase